MKGYTDISLSWMLWSDPLPKPTGLCPTEPLPGLNEILRIVCLWNKKKTKKKHVCRFLLRQQRLEALRSDLLSCTFNVYRFSQGRSVKWMVLDRCTFLWENNGSLWNCTANLQILKKSNVLYCLFLYMKSIYFHFIWSKDERKWKRKWLITNLNPQETDQK